MDCDDEAVKDLAVSMRPGGIAADEIPAFVDFIIGIVRLEAMKWRWNPETRQWFNPDNGVVDTRQFNGLKEIVEAGTVNVGFGQARPKPGDLKPSESLLRSLANTEKERLAHARAEARARLEQIDREIESGQMRVTEGSFGEDRAIVTDERGVKHVVPRRMLSQTEVAQLEREATARAEAHYAPKAPPRGPVEADAQGVTIEERTGFLKALAAPQQEVAIMSNAPSPEARPPTPQRQIDPSAIESFDKGAFPCIAKGR